MAQWIGQFSGLTHKTKVHDLEESLRLAVAAYATARETERASRAHGVHQLAERLLAARLKALRAQLSALQEPGAKQSIEPEFTRLKRKEQELATQDVADILREFHFNESKVT